MMINRVFLIISVFVLWSCGVSEQQRFYLTKIDSLQTMLDSAENQYQLLDTSSLSKSINAIDDGLTRLRAIDTVWSDSVKVYAFIGKSLKEFHDEHFQIMEEIDYSEKQLSTLKKDIRKGRLTEKQMENYYHDEEAALGQLLHKMWFNKESIEYQLQSFDYLQDKIERMIDQHEPGN